MVLTNVPLNDLGAGAFFLSVLYCAWAVKAARRALHLWRRHRTVGTTLFFVLGICACCALRAVSFGTLLLLEPVRHVLLLEPAAALLLPCCSTVIDRSISLRGVHAPLCRWTPTASSHTLKCQQMIPS